MRQADPSDEWEDFPLAGSGPLEFEIVESLLKSSGIPVVLRGQHDYSHGRRLQLLVPRSAFDDARRIIEAARPKGGPAAAESSRSEPQWSALTFVIKIVVGAILLLLFMNAGQTIREILRRMGANW